MNTQGYRGYFSLIQFRPDASRMETVNVGIILLCPSLNFLASTCAKDFRRCEMLMRENGWSEKRLAAHVHTVESRVHFSPEDLMTHDQLDHFACALAGDIQVTRPRSVKITGEPAETLLKMFRELVEVHE